jgi:hypothetical protein
MREGCFFLCFWTLIIQISLFPIFFSAGYEVAFIHPKSAAGVLVELVQAPADVVKALS